MSDESDGGAEGFESATPELEDDFEGEVSEGEVSEGEVSEGEDNVSVDEDAGWSADADTERDDPETAADAVDGVAFENLSSADVPKSDPWGSSTDVPKFDPWGSSADVPKFDPWGSSADVPKSDPWGSLGGTSSGSPSATPYSSTDAPKSEEVRNSSDEDTRPEDEIVSRSGVEFVFTYIEESRKVFTVDDEDEIRITWGKELASIGGVPVSGSSDEYPITIGANSYLFDSDCNTLLIEDVIVVQNESELPPNRRSIANMHATDSAVDMGNYLRKDHGPDRVQYLAIHQDDETYKLFRVDTDTSVAKPRKPRRPKAVKITVHKMKKKKETSAILADAREVWSDEREFEREERRAALEERRQEEDEAKFEEGQRKKEAKAAERTLEKEAEAAERTLEKEAEAAERTLEKEAKAAERTLEKEAKAAERTLEKEAKAAERTLEKVRAAEERAWKQEEKRLFMSQRKQEEQDLKQSERELRRVERTRQRSASRKVDRHRKKEEARRFEEQRKDDLFKVATEARKKNGPTPKRDSTVREPEKRFDPRNDITTRVRAAQHRRAHNMELSPRGVDNEMNAFCDSAVAVLVKHRPLTPAQISRALERNNPGIDLELSRRLELRDHVVRVLHSRGDSRVVANLVGRSAVPKPLVMVQSVKPVEVPFVPANRAGRRGGKPVQGNWSERFKR